eukprot:TRINITY_DN7129_c0_g1_i1.p1 TRINITY_DN7129_c0_g1~~TRINITY_DN7129_c0_g1_i1.p1  ORF type:complete len:140 (+),score=26.54 TRINITY_DN7129_c0_g1_i1:416-835(+)
MDKDNYLIRLKSMKGKRYEITENLLQQIQFFIISKYKNQEKLETGKKLSAFSPQTQKKQAITKLKLIIQNINENAIVFWSRDLLGEADDLQKNLQYLKVKLEQLQKQRNSEEIVCELESSDDDSIHSLGGGNQIEKLYF